MPLSQLQSDLDRCNKCGFCMAGCPTYRAGGQLEWLVTRGRVSLLQDALAGTLPLTEAAIGIDTCLLCNACMEHCPPKVDIDALISGARAAQRQERPLSAPARFLLRQVLPRPALLRLLARAGALGERLGLRRLARHLPALRRLADTGPALPGVTARELLRGVPLKPSGAPKARVAYFVSCTKETLYPRAAVAAVRVLVAAGCEVVLPELPCCGLPCHTAGDPEGERRLAEAHKAIFAGAGVSLLISDDGSCAAHLTGILPVKDLATFLSELGLPAPVRRIERRITWHDPCGLRHHLGVHGAPRKLIRGIPGVEYLEAPDAAMCCGGAGTFMLTQPELSDSILAIKEAGFRAVEPELIVTSSPSCLIQLGRRLPVTSLAELLEQAYCT